MHAWCAQRGRPVHAATRLRGDHHQGLPLGRADPDNAHIGAIVLAMGSPYGLTDSVTQGIVSANGGTVTGPTIAGHPPTIIVNAIQTSAPINSGNSGGALVLLSGYVLGIPTLNAQDPEIGAPALGIGFAIGSNTVVAIGRQLIRTAKVTKSDRASLDIKGESRVNSASKPDGVTVVAARPGGAAADAGIRAGEVIAGVAGQATLDIAALESALIGYRPGERVKVEVLHHGNPRQFSVRLGSSAADTFAPHGRDALALSYNSRVTFTMGSLAFVPAADRPDLLAPPVAAVLTDPSWSLPAAEACVCEIDPDLADTAALCDRYGPSA